MVGKGVVRFGVSVPSKLLEEFDKSTSRMGYDRSKAIQLAMRNLLTEYTWETKQEGTAAGTLTIIYDHDTRGLEESLTDTQHHHRDIITSAMHVHLDERRCLSVIAVKGKVNSIQTLAKELMSKRGIEQLKLATVT